MSVRFSVLGPVEVRATGRRLPTMAPRHRAVLAYLLLHAGTVINAERLIGAMWGQTPPDSARAQIHAAVAAIRRMLRAAGAAQALVTRAGGYVILPQPGQLDLQEFTRQVAAAQAQADAGDRQAAAAQLRATLTLWGGQPLADVNAAYVPDARQRLEGRRLTALERLADLELSLGRHEDLIDGLSALAAEYPLRERLSSQLMMALHGAGRQADALSVARAFRATLAEEQGLDPSRGFAALEQAILRDDPGLGYPPAPAAGRPAAGQEPPAGTAPRDAGQGEHPRRANFLPYDPPDFAGRAAELGQLAPPQHGGGGTVTISAIDGMAGIGKTALAIHAAHRLASGFPDGQLFVDLQAHTTGQAPLEANAALGILLRQLGVPAENIPAAVTARAALWRAELAERRVLVVLDNAAGMHQVQPLLPGASSSLIMITSRRRLTGLDGAQALSVDLLPAKDAVDLFTQIVGDRAKAEPDAVLTVLELCGLLPLAVRIAAARLQHRPQWSVEYLAGRLRDQGRRLAELSTSERSVAAAFGMSYQQLEPDQQCMFRLLGLHPGRDIGADAAAALAGITPEAAEVLLEDLLDVHVLLQHEPGRYTFHDLLRQHARGTVSGGENAGARHDALTRLLDHYLYTASTAVDLVYPYSKQLRPRIPEPETTTVRLTGAADATAWLDAERANLIAAGIHAAERAWPAHASHLAATLHRYLDDHAHHTDALVLHLQALHASRRCGDKAAEVHALLNLSVTHWRQGGYEQATELSQQALDLSRATGERLGEARAWYRLGAEYLRQRDYDRALDCYQRSLDVNRQIGERLGEANVLGNLGLVYERQGRYEQAHAHHRQALKLYRRLGALGGEATTLSNLGLVYRRQGRYEQARAHHRQALDLFGELGYQRDQAEALNGLGEAARAMGDPAQAIDDHGTALALARTAGSRPEQARAQGGLAQAHYDLGHVGLARDHASHALDLYTGLGVPEAAEFRRLLGEWRP